MKLPLRNVQIYYYLNMSIQGISMSHFRRKDVYVMSPIQCS